MDMRAIEHKHAKRKWVAAPAAMVGNPSAPASCRALDLPAELLDPLLVPSPLSPSAAPGPSTAETGHAARPEHEILAQLPARSVALPSCPPTRTHIYIPYASVCTFFRDKSKTKTKQKKHRSHSTLQQETLSESQPTLILSVCRVRAGRGRRGTGGTAAI